jgi:hypothetical protein
LRRAEGNRAYRDTVAGADPFQAFPAAAIMPLTVNEIAILPNGLGERRVVFH